jgi:hypothetical protein
MRDLWPLVLHLAAKQGIGEGTLHDGLGSAMSAGCGLEYKAGALTIVPGALSAPEYAAVRMRYLVAHREALINVLRAAGKEGGGNGTDV